MQAKKLKAKFEQFVKSGKREDLENYIKFGLYEVKRQHNTGRKQYGKK